MTTTVAVAHIVGALVALEILGIGFIQFADWTDTKGRTRALADIASALGIPLAGIEDPAHSTSIVEHLRNRFDPALLDNRLSDLCGTLQVYWKWAGYLVQYGFLVLVMWQAMTYDKSVSVYAWLVLAIALAAWSFSLLFSWLCHVSTGRYPGQARRTLNKLSRIS